MKIRSLYSANFKVLNNLKIDFTHDGNINPITVITGINGCGKTTLFEFIYKVLSFYKVPDLMHLNNSYIEIDPREKQSLYQTSPDRGMPSSLKLDNSNLLNIKHNTKFNLSSHIIYYPANKDNDSAEKIIINYIDELIYEKDIKGSIAYIKLKEILNTIFKDLNLQIEFDRLDKDKNVYFRNKFTKDLQLKDLSGGEKTIITKVLPLYISGFKNGIILIDEPETSLHPNWQSQIIDLYKKAAKSNNNQLIIATHSPHIVSSVEQKYIKIFVKEETGIKVVDNEYNSYGKRIEDVLLEVFQINGLRTPIIENKMHILDLLLQENKEGTSEFKEILKELENTIGYYDSELASIRMEVLRKNKINEEN